jgi:hypothetical protein
MTPASLLAFPGSRRLAGWWRLLAPYQPQAIWVGHLLFHHVEALVRLTQSGPVDAFNLFLLRAVALVNAETGAALAGAPLERLDDRLGLGRSVLRQALRGLEAEALIEPVPAGGGWSLTDLGQQALGHKAYARARLERRVFTFVEPLGKPNGGGRTPHFLIVHNSTGIAWPVPEDIDFDIRLLSSCLARPAEWKARHGFPADVQEILGVGPPPPRAGLTLPPPWRRVIVDRPERVLAVLVLSAAAGHGRLTGLAVQPDGWVLHAGKPLFTVGAGWPEVFPGLDQEPPLEAWQQAWRAWCEPRGIPADEAAACTLEQRGLRLHVTAPHRLVERLRQSRSDALKGETWLLAGEGKVRQAAQVAMAEAGPTPV